MPLVGLGLMALSFAGFLVWLMMFAPLSPGETFGLDQVPTFSTLAIVIQYWLILSFLLGSVLLVVGTFVVWPMRFIYRKSSWKVWAGYAVVVLGWVGMIGFRYWSRSFTVEERVSQRELIAVILSLEQLATMIMVFGTIVFAGVLQVYDPKKGRK